MNKHSWRGSGDAIRQIVAACALAALPACVLAGPAPQPSDPPEPVLRDLSQPPALSDEMIRKAVRDTIAEDPHPADPASVKAGAFGTSASTAQDKMSAAFEQAKVPDCLHGDALKLQPAYIGPVAVVGPYSLPWVIAAVVRGKCH